VRRAALAVAALAVAAAFLLRRPAAGRALAGSDWRVVAFFAASAILWLASSANARYGLPVLLLAGVILARLGERLLPARAARLVLAGLLVLQLAALAVAAHPRWYLAEPWTSEWLPYAPPERAQREPALYLTVEIQPMMAVAPFLHPGSAFVNLRGQHSLPADAPRLAGLLERFRGRVRILAHELDPSKPGPYDAALRRIGYRVDAADCLEIPWRRDEDGVSRAANRIGLARTAPESLSLTSCALRPQPRDPADATAERRAAALFDRIEKTCPRLFRGQTAVTEPLGDGWSRNYNGLDARLEAGGERVVLRYHRGSELLELGRATDWERGGVPPQCGPAGGSLAR
jgi:hypothetical protein